MIPSQRGGTTEMRQRTGATLSSLLASSALTIAVTVIIWAVTGAGFFWPIWVIFGLSVVLLGSAWRAVRPQHSGERTDPNRPLDRD